MGALAKEVGRRRLVLPESFDVPDRAMWIRGYRSEAKRTVGLEAVQLDDALAIVRGFLDPLLAGVAAGEWNPSAQRWESR